MAEGRIKSNPLQRQQTNRRLNTMVSFGAETQAHGTEYHERIKRIMRKLKEISVRIDKLASNM